MKKKDPIVTGYSELVILFTEIGIDFIDSGPAEQNLGKQVVLSVMDEQGAGPAITFYFNIDKDGNETFVCQE
jgi:hypothetical protein